MDFLVDRKCFLVKDGAFDTVGDMEKSTVRENIPGATTSPQRPKKGV
jgi:hypothetical protein